MVNKYSQNILLKWMAFIRSKILIGFLFVIRAYQLIISPFLGNNCRFYPSCSHYSIDALKEYGLIKGLWLSVCRIMRCHPFSKGGIDPIPSKRKHNG